MNRNIKYFLKLLLIVTLVFLIKQNVFAADVNLTIRDVDSIVFSGTIPFPSSIISLNDSSGMPHEVNSSSVLAVLASADETSENFSISNLQYFDSFNSLYLKCITDTTGEKCDDWQYVVNDTYPGIGMDQNILSGEENIYVYFGPQNRVQLSSSSINTNDNLIVTTEKYDYQNNSWTTRTGVAVGITQPDPNNPFSPTEIKTSPVDEAGKANFSSIPAGSYNVGIKEDYYFPTTPLEVANPPSGGGGGSVGGSGSSGASGCCISTNVTIQAKTTIPIKPTFDIEKAFQFLLSQQKENGSFGEDLYTDWVALALASGNYQNQTIKLIKYYNESKFESTLLTDHERRAMALMALGLNPYSFNPAKDGASYIEKIITSFDGKQFGDVNEDNDDIFALIVLQNTGYTKEDKIINNTVDFLLKRQKENGSWDESVDMTGASIEALSVFNEKEEVKNALDKAKNYLKINQKEDGGWGNSFSTSWALEGILAINEKPEEWNKSNNTPFDYFANIQDEDGGIKNENIQNKIWETAYAIPVLSNKNWNELIQKFEKQEIKPIVKVAKKNLNKKILTANVINAASIPPTENKVEIPRKSWFARFFENIWNSF